MPQLPANPRPTIHDVAAALGMAKSTVSKGLTGKGTLSTATRERIMQVSREMGYEPNHMAQRLANKGENRLVYLCAAVMDVGIATAKLLAIQRGLKKLRYEVPIVSVANAYSEEEKSQAEEIRDLCRQQPRAIVYASQGWEPAVLPLLRRYLQSGGIVVSYDIPWPLECDQVIFDREHTAYQTARHLIERGHRHLGISIPGPNVRVSARLTHHTNPRLVGFCRAVEEAGLKVEDQWFCGPRRGYEPGGRELAASYLALQERPSGLCIVNDYSSLGFMTEVMKAGVRIPGDVSIIGQDNQEVAQHCPVPLTAATQPVAEIVQTVIDLITARLDGDRQPPRTVTIRGDIVERNSVTLISAR